MRLRDRGYARGLAAPDPPASEVQTERLVLRRPSREDLHELFLIESDPRVWTHYPSLRPVAREQTLALIDRWLDGWAAAGLGKWTARLQGGSAVIGSGGCSLLGNVVWTLGYRFAADLHGHGYATELASEALRRANGVDPALPVVASLLEHNTASERVAIKLGMRLVHRAPDTGNPDPSAVRLVYADRPLSTAELSVAIG